MLGGMSLDSLLFGPRHVVRSEQAFYANRELHTQAGVCKQQLLPNGYVQHAPEHTKLLVHSSRLQNATFSIAKGSLDLNTLTKTPPQVLFDLVGRDVHEFAHAKDGLEAFRDGHVDFVRTLCAEGRLRIVLQKEVGPLPEAHRLAFLDCIEDVVVSGLKPLSESSLGFIPVFREC